MNDTIVACKLDAIRNGECPFGGNQFFFSPKGLLFSTWHVNNGVASEHSHSDEGDLSGTIQTPDSQGIDADGTSDGQYIYILTARTFPKSFHRYISLKTSLHTLSSLSDVSLKCSSLC